MADTFKLIDQAEVRGKRVLVRVDWNVTLGKALAVVDDTRIVRTLPTIKWILDHGASQVILMSHLGKAEERRSLEPVVRYADKLLGETIELKSSIEQCHSDTVSRIMMLENLRFWEGEEKNEPAFAQELASLGDIYVNEAFGECHREAASIVGIPKYLLSYAGLWLGEEVEIITKVVSWPERPLLVVMGGAKVKDKMGLLEQLSQRADVIILGGKVANEYLEQNVKLGGTARIVTPVDGIGRPYLDIGEHSQKMFAREIGRARTIVWNGPMGKVEEERYRGGTWAVMEAIAGNTEAYRVVGGGDTLAALHHEDILSLFDHVSTGGGAMLKLIESGSLPGIEVLKSRT